MRSRIASAPFVLFALFATVPRASAQSKPIPSQPPQQTPQKPPSSAKLLPLPSATQITLLANQADSTNDRTSTSQPLQAWIGALENQKNGLALSLQRFGSGPDAPNCAHIRIIQAPEMDSEMVLQTSPSDGGPIQTFQGLPPCRRDLPAPMTAQRFPSAPPMLPIPPRKPSVLPPASQFSSSQPLPVQPKQDTPNPNP